jgi:hypothetical protein
VKHDGEGSSELSQVWGKWYVVDGDRTWRDYKEGETYLTTSNPNPHALSSPPFFLEGPKNINIDIPTVTRLTTRYL